MTELPVLNEDTVTQRTVEPGTLSLQLERVNTVTVLLFLSRTAWTMFPAL
jgi:hypothetical protein